MGLLIMRLLVAINTYPLNSTYHHIATVFIQNYNLLKESSINEMADLSNVAKSTLSKFAKELGFDNYKHLKDNADFIENRYNNKYNYLTNIIEFIGERNYLEYFELIMESIIKLEDSIDILAIDRLVDDLIKYEKVGIFGLLFSESAAIDFQYKLAYNQKFVVTYQDELKQEEYIKNADENTLLIILSNSGNYLREQQISPGKPPKRYFHNAKAKIFAITSDKTILDLEHVNDALIYPKNDTIETHNVLYQIIFDIIIARYRLKISD